nr:hypothetical protein [Flavobacterium sp. ASV13]
MKKIGILLIFITLSFSAFSQQNGTNQATSLCNGHWEFFMSDVAAKYTFKVDKFTGDVYQFVQKEDKTYTWQFIEKETSNRDIVKQDSINYQLFSSGLGIRFTFLLNINSGLTWQLVRDEKEGYFFHKIE